ncbi:hypothetical protein D3C76_1245890 [compost metagenome]
MIHQHPRGNLGVPGIRHLKVLNIGSKRLIQIYFPGIHQHHGGCGDNHLAHRANAVHAFPGDWCLRCFVVKASTARQYDFPLIPNGILQTCDSIILHQICGHSFYLLFN